MTTEPNSLFIRIPQPTFLEHQWSEVSPSPPFSPIVPSDSSDEDLKDRMQFAIKIPAFPQIPPEEDEDEEIEKVRRTSCPDELRSQVFEMMERHTSLAFLATLLLRQRVPRSGL